MRGFRSTLILLVVLLGLLGYIYFVEMKQPKPNQQVEQKQKVFSVESDKIEEIRVKTADGATSVLKKTGGVWSLTEPIPVKADDTEVTGIVTNLASMEIQRVVDEQPKDVAQFGLAAPKLEIAFRKAGQTDFAKLLVGDKTATGGDLYAKLPAEKRVFLIPAFLETTLNRTPFDLRDKVILRFDREKTDLLEIQSKDGRISASKTGIAWRMVTPVAARADMTAVEGLVGRLQTLQMKAIAAEGVAEKELGKYGLDKPEYVATVGAGSARTTLQVGQADPSGARWARDLAKPGVVVTIDASLTDDLKKTADDFRPKDVFEFKSFTASRIEVTRGTATVVYERVKNPDGSSKWRRVSPAKDAAQGDLDAALGALSGLAVEKYVDAKTKTGADAPVAVITARFDDGKQEEKVTFGKVGADLYAVRAGEPGAAKVDSARFDEALKAFDAIK
jgi:hypothetical protein